MNIEGTYTLQAPSQDVWKRLVDQHVLLYAIPDIEQIEQIDKDTYAIAIHIKQAPFDDTYHGRVTIVERQHPYHFRLVIEGEGRQNTISGSGSVHLNERDDTTIIAYQGSLSINKRGSRLPVALVKGAAKLFIQRYFTTLANQLYMQRSESEPGLSSEQEEAAVLKGTTGNIVILPASALESSQPLSPASEPVGEVRSIFTVPVRLLGLGEGDPDEEQRWEQRLRRLSIITVLLFLVWLGTRIPRRNFSSPKQVENTEFLTRSS